MGRNLNISNATNLALQAKALAENPLQAPGPVLVAPGTKPPRTSSDGVANLYAAEIDSTNNPQDVDLYASAANNSGAAANGMQYKDETYFPINLNLPGSTPANTDPANAPLTETEKRQRANLIGGIILLTLTVLIIIYSMKKK